MDIILESLDKKIKKIRKNDARPNRIELPGVRRIPSVLSQKLHFIINLSELEQAIFDISSLPVTAIGIDTEFQYRNTKYLKLKSDGTPAKDSRQWCDIKSITPLLLSIAVVVENFLITYVVDLRVKGITPLLQKFFNSGYKFISHYVKAEYFCLKTLGVDMISCDIYDTCIAGQTINLGKFHYNYTGVPTDEFEEEELKKESEEKKEENNKLESLCRKYNINHKYSKLKLKMQLSFSEMVDGQDFTKEQIEYAAEDAIATVKIYFFQIQDLIKQNLLTHNEQIEFPYALVNAQCEWNGVYICTDKCQLAIRSIKSKVKKQQDYFRREFKLNNANSSKQLLEFFRDIGVLGYFKDRTKKSGYSFSKEKLKLLKDMPIMVNGTDVLIFKEIFEYKKMIRVFSDKSLTGYFTAVDDRVHPNWQQLGSDTGRTQAKHPAVASIGKIFRPIVQKTEGFLIGECDLGQIEMGVAADRSEDLDLIKDYNSGDIYVGSAKRIYKDSLTESEISLSSQDFADYDKSIKTAELRAKIKIFCLAVVYNMSESGVSTLLNCTKGQAKKEIKRFFAMYPKLESYLNELSAIGQSRGYATTVTGLKRYRKLKGKLTCWEYNWIRNTPIQGSAADLFKKIVIRLTKIYMRYDARIILQLHDSVVFEAPVDVFSEVASITKKVMEEEVELMFPSLIGKADLNIKSPNCWNKDGNSDSIEKFLEETLK